MLDYVIKIVGHLGHWGYLAIFLVVVLECQALLGLVMPGENLVLMGGFLAGQGLFELGVLIGVVSGANSSRDFRAASRISSVSLYATQHRANNRYLKRKIEYPVPGYGWTDHGGLARDPPVCSRCPGRTLRPSTQREIQPGG